MKKPYPQKSISLIVQFIVLLLFIIPAKAQEQYFTDETDQRMPRPSGPSMSADVADIDNDGDLDITGDAWAAVPPHKPYYLFISDENGYFTNETEERLPDTAFNSTSVGFGDIDSDGDYDIYVSSENYQDLLYINNGTGYFLDETYQRLPTLACHNIGFVFGDFSGDSFLDIITICSFSSGLNYYFLNDGTGYFEDVTDIRMPADSVHDIFGAPADLDNDLDLDLLLTWFELDGSHLHIRGLENIDGYFTHFEEGRMDDRFARWIDTADIDNDGDLDIVISGIISMGILINQEGLFVDESEERLPDYDIYWGGCNMIGLGDYDNDGDIDIYAGFSVDEKDHLFVNDGQGYFELADERIPDTEASTRWPEPFDADGDGDLDLFLGCSGNGQQRILINHSTPDTIPPSILAEDLPLGDVDSLVEYQVKISTYDNKSVEKGALTVSIFYRINGGDFKRIHLFTVAERYSVVLFPVKLPEHRSIIILKLKIK